MEIVAGSVVGLVVGFTLFWFLHKYKTGGFDRVNREIISQAERDADKLMHSCEIQIKEKELEHQRKIERERELFREKTRLAEDRLLKREDKLEARMNLVEQKLSQVEKREAAIAERKLQNDEEKSRLKALSEKIISELESISGLTSSEAKENLYKRLIDDTTQEAAAEMQRLRTNAVENGKLEAAKIIATAINRMAVSCASEGTAYTISLPSSELKGRIIGREGRNIRLLERLTGVNILIDDTPNAVVVSGLDPIRLHIAKTALSRLVEDGRIHQTNIEQYVTEAENSIEALTVRAGEEAALETGQSGLHPELIKLLGGLHFRRSLGQNVLKHSIEVSHIMGLIAAEMQLDIKLAKRIGLLHDMGKAAPAHLEGTHALVGQMLALKFGESAEVANGIGCHHNEIEPISIEGSLCGAADAISAARPGARLEAVQQYLQRISSLEEIAYRFPGIEKAYALQAGKEVIISVLPEMIDDKGTVNLARDISNKIKEELEYPGKIKVTVLREKRAVDYAT